VQSNQRRHTGHCINLHHRASEVPWPGKSRLSQRRTRAHVGAQWYRETRAASWPEATRSRGQSVSDAALSAGAGSSCFAIRRIDFGDADDVAKHDKMVGLVEQMLALNTKAAHEDNPETLRLFRRQLASTDRQIDRLVYDLYGLTEEDIELVGRSK